MEQGCSVEANRVLGKDWHLGTRGGCARPKRPMRQHDAFWEARRDPGIKDASQIIAAAPAIRNRCEPSMRYS